MILTDRILKLEEWDTNMPIDKDRPELKKRGSQVQIDVTHILKYCAPIQSDFQVDNIEATQEVYKRLLNHEFKEEDFIIQENRIGHDNNGYDIYLRINYTPYLKGWAKTLGEAIMVKDWFVKAQ